MKKIIIYTVILFMLMYPLLVGFSNYYLTIFFMMSVYVITALGLNLLLGFGGQVSVGQAGFLMVGAYSVAILSSKVGLPFIVTLPLAGIITGIVGLIIGLSAARLKGHFLAVVTLGFGISVPQIILNWQGLTGGYSGMSVAKPTFIFGIHFYYVVVLITLFIIFIIYNLVNSSLGRAFIAIRDSEVAAQSMGINVPLYKLLMFVISSFFTGVAGGLYAYWFSFVSPNDFTLATSFLILAMVVVGGLASIPGAIIGAMVLSLIPHYTDQFVGLTNLIIGVLMVFIILVRPNGLASIKKMSFKNLTFGKKVGNKGVIKDAEIG
ncbi:branched-chain amino acid ABC transporter permease [Psychrobacillus sp. OK032]|uniref:branched-chain amino acid ABC transporter permease n=1 Tax=Psychrobacillus sp. OK032 TaxID=1884358 RepID=UPI0008CEF927|nr:branched-chain amino acid ABC transporter permease [Psychrobacillus sp. OK032]SER86835.1 amino acid/amide ABC transporter membrane protein 2, HAAT family [Psychrobacillus sp. OK032]